MDTVPFSEFFADELLDDTVTSPNLSRRTLSSKKSNLSIKTYVLEDSVISQIVNGLKSPDQFGDPWLSRRKSILPTIAETDDQFERASVVSSAPVRFHPTPQSIAECLQESGQDQSDQPFPVDLDNCLLTSIIRRGTPKPETALLYAAQLVASISSLHVAGIVHGLISPETVAIRDEKYLVLCDCERRTRTTSPTLRNSPPLRGHEHQRMYLYTAPEIILGWTQGSAVDSWGFGVVLYYLLIGFHPFGDRDGQEDRIVNAKSHTLRYLHLLDKDSGDLVSKCLERNPALRPSILEVKAHPYFSEIDWSKMVTRYVRVLLNEAGEHQVEHSISGPLSRQVSTLFSPSENPGKPFSEIELPAANLGSNFEIPNDEKPCPEPAPPKTDEGSSIPSNTVKSEWFLSTADVLEIVGSPESDKLKTVEEKIAKNEWGFQKEPDIFLQGLVRPTREDHNDKDRRMKLFWDMLDAEEDDQAISAPASGISNSLTYFTSRPRRLCKRRSPGVLAAPVSQLSLWRSSIEVSNARLGGKNKQDGKMENTSDPNVQTLEPEYEDFNFPPGIERIGNGIGYTYALPAASRSKLSVCSSVPRSCHGMFGYSPKFSLGLGIGMGQATLRRTKAKPADNIKRKSLCTSQKEESPSSSPEWDMSSFCDGNTTTVMYASTQPALTNMIPTSMLYSPQQDSDGGDTDDTGPLTPDMVAFESRPDMVKSFGEPKLYEGITETPTLRLVSPKVL
ncbi:hypothetical protein AX15_002441 [Amanita polypyramis BW_CC]|nr:hypothetical protein AX15_002441 [Amanita polypyramis BW_CC]